MTARLHRAGMEGHRGVEDICNGCGLSYRQMKKHRCKGFLASPPDCACGCGEPVSGYQKDSGWSQYLPHHHLKRRDLWPPRPTPLRVEASGQRKVARLKLPPPFCECGCGQRVRNQFNGVWSRWCVGHHMRGVNGYIAKSS